MFQRVRRAMARKDWAAADRELKALTKFLGRQVHHPGLTSAERAALVVLGLSAAFARRLIAPHLPKELP